MCVWSALQSSQRIIYNSAAHVEIIGADCQHILAPEWLNRLITSDFQNHMTVSAYQTAAVVVRSQFSNSVARINVVSKFVSDTFPCVFRLNSLFLSSHNVVLVLWSGLGKENTFLASRKKQGSACFKLRWRWSGVQCKIAGFGRPKYGCTCLHIYTIVNVLMPPQKYPVASY